MVLRRPNGSQPLDFGVHLPLPLVEWHLEPAARVDVDVNSVLTELWRFHLLEVDSRALPFGVNYGTGRVPLPLGHALLPQPVLPRLATGRWVLLLVVQCLGVERGETRWVLATEDDLQLEGHRQKRSFSILA